MIIVEQRKRIERLKHEIKEYTENNRVNTSVIANLKRTNFTLIAGKHKAEEEKARLKVQVDEEGWKLVYAI